MGLPKRDWVKIVKESNGQQVFLPEELNGEMVEIERERVAFDERLLELSEIEIRLKKKQQDLMFKFREIMSKRGVKTWNKDVGFETSALSEGVFVVNILNPQGR